MTQRYILAIDGGGVRGIVAAIFLEALSTKLKEAGGTRPLADYFDVIIGTSSGAIVAAGLSAGPVPDADPASAAEIRRLFEKNARKIFPSRWFCEIPVIGRLPQLFGPFYSENGLVKVLRAQLGDARFGDLKHNLLIPAYSIDPRDTLLFRGGPSYGDDIEARPYKSVAIADAILGSAAAPTFFPPHKLQLDGEAGPRTIIDGGVYVNDPAMVGVAEAIRLFPDDDFHVLSIGTGRQTLSYPYKKARGWGFSQWLSPTGRFKTPLISAIQDGQTRAVSRQLHYLLGEHYMRFDYMLEGGRGSDRLDDASSRNMSRLVGGAFEMIQKLEGDFENFATKLLADRE